MTAEESGNRPSPRLVDPIRYQDQVTHAFLGRRFDETGAMPAEEWSSIFTPVNDRGEPIPPNNLPLMITLAARRPAHACFFIRGLDGVVRHVDVAAIPIAGLQGEFLGAAAIFWELSE